MALRRILADPLFVFRFERDPDSLPVGRAHRITDIELASRLSFFLWSSIPDEELLTVAEQGKLKDPAVLQQQVRRMLKDPKSQALITNFSGQWLFLRELRNRQPDLLLFPDFDDNLRQSFQRETEMLFGSIVREDRNVFDILTADYTFVNERLARHYGIPNIYGTDFRRVNVPSSARKGLLGQGSFLTVTSAANRTSPVTRGAWILENLLGSPPPLPPPNVPPLPETTNGQGIKKVATSVRERMEQHRDQSALQGLPSDHGSDRPLARKLRRRRTMANRGHRLEDRHGRSTRGRHDDRWRRKPAYGAAALPRCLRPNDDGKADDVCNRPRSPLLRYAGSPRDYARSSRATTIDFQRWLTAIVSSDPFQMRVKKAEEAH